MKCGWFKHSGDTSYSYQYDFDVMLVLGKTLKCDEMLKVQIKEKDLASREDAIEWMTTLEVIENEEVVVSKNMKEKKSKKNYKE